MFVASRFQVIKDIEGEPEVTEEMLEKLDAMLTEYGVNHFFALPMGDEDGVAINDDEVAVVYYDGDVDRIKFNLVYVLWSKAVRQIHDERIERGIKRWADRL